MLLEYQHRFGTTEKNSLRSSSALSRSQLPSISATRPSTVTSMLIRRQAVICGDIYAVRRNGAKGMAAGETGVGKS